MRQRIGMKLVLSTVNRTQGRMKFSTLISWRRNLKMTQIELIRAACMSDRMKAGMLLLVKVLRKGVARSWLQWRSNSQQCRDELQTTIRLNRMSTELHSRLQRQCASIVAYSRTIAVGNLHFQALVARSVHRWKLRTCASELTGHVALLTIGSPSSACHCLHTVTHNQSR